jgi:hypothetical protein
MKKKGFLARITRIVIQERKPEEKEGWITVDKHGKPITWYEKDRRYQCPKCSEFITPVVWTKKRNIAKCPKCEHVDKTWRFLYQ